MIRVRQVVLHNSAQSEVVDARMVDEIRDEIRNLIYHMYDYGGCMLGNRDLVEESNSFERDMDERVNLKAVPNSDIVLV